MKSSILLSTLFYRTYTCIYCTKRDNLLSWLWTVRHTSNYFKYKIYHNNTICNARSIFSDCATKVSNNSIGIFTHESRNQDKYWKKNRRRFDFVWFYWLLRFDWLHKARAQTLAGNYSDPEYRTRTEKTESDGKLVLFTLHIGSFVLCGYYVQSISWVWENTLQKNSIPFFWS